MFRLGYFLYYSLFSIFRFSSNIKIMLQTLV